jgi:hypothetical protein
MYRGLGLKTISPTIMGANMIREALKVNADEPAES